MTPLSCNLSILFTVFTKLSRGVRKLDLSFLIFLRHSTTFGTVVFWLSLALSEFRVIYWIGFYLTNRKQRVKIDGVSSDWCKIEAGVPQNSVLGPLLFLIYINDLPSSVGSSCFLFANDCFLLNLVHSPVSCANALNDDLAFYIFMD